MPGPNRDPIKLSVQKVIAVAIKEAEALELMGAPSLFDLGEFDPPEPGRRRGD